MREIWASSGGRSYTRDERGFSQRKQDNVPRDTTVQTVLSRPCCASDVVTGAPEEARIIGCIAPLRVKWRA